MEGPATFYLALRDIVNTGREGELYGDNDTDIIYPLEKIDVITNTGHANAFFYYLSHKDSLYNQQILINNLTSKDKKEIEILAQKINVEKYFNCSFNKDLLVQIGNDFLNDILPKYYNLLYEFNATFSNTFNFLIQLLHLILIFGVFIPIICPFFIDYI